MVSYEVKKIAGGLTIALLPVVILIAIIISLFMNTRRSKRFRKAKIEKPLQPNLVYGFARIHLDRLENNLVIAVPQQAHTRVDTLPAYSRGVETAPLYHDIENDPIIIRS